MLRRIIALLFLSILLIAALLTYVNKVIIPQKIKSLIISGIEDATRRQASVREVNFNLWRGIVLKDLVISEKGGPLLSVKDASCSFSLFPLLARRLVIPAIRLNSAVVNVSRRRDNTFNISDIFIPKEEAGPERKAFSVSVYQIAIRTSRLNFADEALDQAFRKSLDNISLNVYLALPANVKFNLKAEAATNPRARLRADGQFKIPSQQLKATVNIRDFPPAEFSAYLGNLADILEKTTVNSDILLEFKDDLLAADLDAVIFNLPVKGRITVSDFENPLLKAKFTSGFDLNAAQKIAGDNFKLSLPGSLFGQGNLSLAVESALKKDAEASLSGYLDIQKASLKFDQLDSPIANINGRINLRQDGISWSGFSANYKGVPYTSGGALDNFKSPMVQLTLTSRGLSLDSAFSLRDKTVNFTKLSGNYLNSAFSLLGSLDLSTPGRPETQINGKIDFNLLDSKALLVKFKEQLDRINPAGIISVNFNLTGNPLDLKSCAIDGTLSSPSLSAYGFRSDGLSADYSLSSGLIDLPAIHIDLYGGTVEGSVKINLNSANTPYLVNAAVEGVKIEKLKADTAARDKDIAGDINGELKLNGFSDDLSKLKGAGKVFITEGKLWQLNLLQGLGSILLGKDFAKIIFNEASCGFAVEDKFVYSDNLSLKGDIANLKGSFKVGFDNSLDALLNVEILSEEAPLSGTFKDVTTAILGRAGRFGVIRISGTLSEPKFKFQPAVTDIIRGLADTFLKKQ